MTRFITTAAAVLAFASASEAAIVYENNLSGRNLQVGTMLTWSTAFEEDNSIFIVEKSEDGANFTNIGTVDGAGTSVEVKDYNFLDIMANSERTYYRLKQVDVDGNSSYSDVAAIPQVYTNNFMVARMSNVATQDVFEVTIDSMVDGDLGYSLQNLRGEEVLREEMMVVAGLNDLSVDLSGHEEGIYKLALSLGDETETLVVKRVDADILKRPNMASGQRLTPGRN